MSGEEPPVQVETDGTVTTVVLNRPHMLNAVNPAMLLGIDRALTQAEQEGARAVVLRGAGRAFCSGADLGDVADNDDDGRAGESFEQVWQRVSTHLAETPLPTIAAVHGFCYAGGLELMLCCDLAVVADDARIADRHAIYGLVAGGGGTQRLPRLIGERRAKWLMFSGADVAPHEAVRIGLANEVCPAETLPARAHDLAQTLAERSPVAHTHVKEAVRLGIGLELGAALEVEQSVVAKHMRSEDVRLGLDAFRRRVMPEFVGR